MPGDYFSHCLACHHVRLGWGLPVSWLGHQLARNTHGINWKLLIYYKINVEFNIQTIKVEILALASMILFAILNSCECKTNEGRCRKHFLNSLTKFNFKLNV